MNDRNFATQEDIKAYCSYHKIVVVWSLDTQKYVHVRNVELENSLKKNAKHTFFKDVAQ